MQVVKNNGVEVFLQEKPAIYWQRIRRPTVDFIEDSPFAVDRQLEDQKLLAEKNRNPRYLEMTKVDKLRSYMIAAPKGQSRSIAMKANVVNKVVREATGIHNYTIVPPPKSKHTLSENDKVEPETNPRVRAYANEAKLKPVVCSFGHRPSSASRTFHPSTMKFRLKPGEILPTTSSGKTGIGLPVAILKKVLHAPKIASLEEVLQQDASRSRSRSASRENTPSKKTSNTATQRQQQQQKKDKKDDFSDLFLSKEDQDSMFSNNTRSHNNNNNNQKSSSTLLNGRKLSPLDHHSHHKKSIEERRHQVRESYSLSLYCIIRYYTILYYML
jgi:hypothetical protein